MRPTNINADYLEMHVRKAASWRRRISEDYPGDERNDAAIKILDRISVSFNDVPHKDMLALRDAWRHAGNRALSIQGEVLKHVGFRSFPDDALGFVHELTDALSPVEFVGVGVP